MKILFALNALALGGTESYVFTVAEQLDRLAHDVAIFSPAPEGGLEVARERGLSVVGAGALDDDYDAALVQDAAVAYEVAELCPGARSVFVAHSEGFDPQLPPQLPGTVDLLIALNDRVATRLRSFAAGQEVVRLRQPIDTQRFLAAGPLPRRPRNALILSNNVVADREAMLRDACRQAGLELVRRGGAGSQTTDPREVLAEADIVFGYGRAILEAMACGRAAFVYDWAGGDGWVTADSYPAVEGSGFVGRGEQVFDAAGLADALSRYDRSMGPLNRDLVMANHRAGVHAQELLEVFKRITTPARRPRAPLAEMARLVRLDWRARAEVHGIRSENARLHRRLHEMGDELTEARERLGRQESETAATVHRYESTLSWRLTRPLRRAAAVIRRLVR